VHPSLWHKEIKTPSRQIKKPSLSSGAKQLYFQAPPQLEQATRPNLEKKLIDLVEEGAEITVTSSSLPFNLSLRISFSQ
jgi:ubiquitin-activating enzyme E1 C